MKITKPWGYELVLSNSSHYTLKEIHVYPGHSLSKQYHRRKQETVYILSGIMLLAISDDPSQVFRLTPGQHHTILAREVHRFSNVEEGELVFLEAATGELLHDTIRLEDKYGRV